MAHGLGFVSFASVDKSTWYSKHARMAVAYQLVLVHCGMTTVASSVVVTRRRRIESKCCTGGTKNPLGSTGTAGSLPISVDCADFGHTYVYGPYSWLSRGKCRKESWGSYAKLRVMEGRLNLSHATGVTSLTAASVLKPVHETLAWITPSPVTWTCWIVGVHVGSMTMLATVVSPAFRRLRRVGFCQSYPGTCFVFCRRKRTTMLRGRFSKGSQVSSFDPQSNQRTLTL